MANLNGQNIGLNYKGILNLNGLNAPLSTTLQAVSDGDGVASPFQLATTSVLIDSVLTVTAEASIWNLKITGTNGNGHIHLRHQASDATATGQSTSLFADSNGDIKWKNDGNYYTTLKSSANSQNSVYTFPNAAAVTIAGIDIAQTYTAIQTFQSNTFASNLFHSGFVSGSWVTTPTGTANNTTLFYSTNGYLGVKIGTATGAAIFNTSAITTSDKTFTLPNSSMTLAGLEIAQTYTATQTVGIANTGTTTTSGFYLNATSPASGTTAVQNSPVLYFSANGWNNTTSTSLTGGYRMYVKSFAPANPPSFEMQFETISGGLVATLNTTTFTMIGAITSTTLNSGVTTITGNNLGQTTTTAYLTLVNTTAATNSVNQNSPVFVLQGNFWTGSASQTGAFRLYNRQLNATAGVGHLVFGYSTAGAAEAESFRISHNGAIYVNGSAGWVANMGGSAGCFRLTDGSGNSATNARIQFGEQSTAAPMLRRIGANLELRFGDDTYGAGFSVGGALSSSALLQADSTTKGFLPPRMNTTQRNLVKSTISITAISGNGTTITYTAANTLVAGDVITITGATTAGYNLTNATVASATSTSFTITNSATGATSTATGTSTPNGLIVFDSTDGKLYMYNGTSWRLITSA